MLLEVLVWDTELFCVLYGERSLLRLKPCPQSTLSLEATEGAELLRANTAIAPTMCVPSGVDPEETLKLESDDRNSGVKPDILNP